MTWSAYWAFLLFAVGLVLIPGPDFAVVTRNTLAGGRRRGRFTAVGVCTSNAVQGAVAVSGLSAIILRAQPVFEAIKWAGVCYLAMLGIRALVSAVRGRYEWPGGDGGTQPAGAAFGGWRQGFLSNITNPKVLVFYLAVLPQFLQPGAGVGWLLAFAWSHAVIGLIYLLALSSGLAKARAVLTSRRVRRTMDGTTGALLLGFSARLAAEHG
ncbi:MAG TPA: LysE family translocator [Streptosporangiaceae bacterium]